MKRAALLIMIATIISKFLGFFRELVLSYSYGASSISDVYIISTTIPSVIFGFVSAGLAAGYIPMYNKIDKNYGEIEANDFTNNLINIILLISSIIILISYFFTENIVKIFAFGFDKEQLELTIRFTRITLFSLYFTALVSISSSFLQMKNNYLIPALIGLPLNFITIISILLSKKYNILLLAIGFLVATVSQLVLMLPYLKKNKYKYKSIIKIKDKNIIEMLYVVVPVILGISVNQINTIVDRTIASKLVVGGISSLNYADRINSFILGIFVLSIVSALYPTISRVAAENNMVEFKRILISSITGINLLVVPSMIGIMIFASPIVSALFGRGAFDLKARELTSSALFYYSIGMLGFGLREVLSRAFYSLQDTKTPMINAILGVMVNIILNIILSRYFGISGLAFATSISGIFTAVLLLISLKIKIGSFGFIKASVSFIKITLASLIMAFIANLSHKYLLLHFNNNLSLAMAISLGAIIYFIQIYFMNIQEVVKIMEDIKKNFNKIFS